MAGLLPLSKYHQVSSSASKSEATFEDERKNESSGGANSISLEESGADKTLVGYNEDLVHHQGKVLVHHQFKGSVLVRFPDPLPCESETGSIHKQRRKYQYLQLVHFVLSQSSIVSGASTESTTSLSLL